MLNRKIIENVLIAAINSGGDFAEIFIEDRISNRINMVDGNIENSLSGRDFGIGIRIFSGFNSVYAYTNDGREENLIKIAKEIGKTLKNGRNDIKLNFTKSNITNNNSIKIMPNSVSKNEKVKLLQLANGAAKGYDNCISQVNCNYFDEEQKILIANTENLFKEDTRVRTRLLVSSIASKDNEMQMGYEAPGASKGFEFYDDLDIEAVAKEASRIAKTMLYADDSPSGKMPVIIHNGFGGVLFHEACGHGLEATSVAKDNSVFANKLGEQVASTLVTAIDDGTLKNEWGSLNIDDEGEETKRNILIENGILKSYLVDKLNARRMNHKLTGSGRRESYKFSPTSRMNNTYIENGNSTFDEIIKNTEEGIFAKKLGGGSVNTATGDFNFAVMEGYIIKNGEMLNPIRGASLIGNGKGVLEKIDMVGNNRSFGQGMCGSMSGSIPTNVGQPTIRVKELTVGGKGGNK